MHISAEFMRHLAQVAAAETLPRFRRQGEVANKLAGGFDPVTEADRQAEQALRRAIAGEFPGHGIIGEEFGAERADAEHLWIVDPIDGTRSFISGVPLWGTLVGLAARGDAVAGMMSQPFTGELFFANDEGAFYEGPGGALPLKARGGVGLAEAVLCTTSPFMFEGAEREAYGRLERSVRLARYGTDCYAYAMVAAGQVDLVAEAGLQPYDIMALIPIIEKAGGVVTDWWGGPAEKGGAILAAATPGLHEAALKVLAEA